MKRKILSYLLCWILSLFLLNMASVKSAEDVFMPSVRWEGSNSVVIVGGDGSAWQTTTINSSDDWYDRWVKEINGSDDWWKGLGEDRSNNQWNWINAKEKCLYWVWKWCFDYERMVFPSSNLDNVNKHKTVLTVLQDVVLWATFMVWTVLMIVIIYCGLMYIFAAWDGKEPTKYKDWLKNAAIWALFVWWGYAIVRLIQYIAKWW